MELQNLARELDLPDNLVRKSLLVEDDPWIREYFCYEEGQSIPKIRDNLKSAYTFWEEVLHAPKDILSIIKEGFKIPFLTEPPSYEKANNSSAISNSEFVTKAVLELLELDRVKEVHEAPT